MHEYLAAREAWYQTPEGKAWLKEEDRALRDWGKEIDL